MAATPKTTVRLVDSRGTVGPRPLHDLTRAYRESSIGDLIELWETDPAFKEEARAWAAASRNEIVSMDERGGEIAFLIHVVRR